MFSLQLKTRGWPLPTDSGSGDQTNDLFNCLVDFWTWAGSRALGPCDVGMSQSSGCSTSLNICTQIKQPHSQSSMSPSQLAWASVSV